MCPAYHVKSRKVYKMNPILAFLVMLIELYTWVIILTVVVSWLVIFDVLNTKNKIVYRICDFLNRITNPVMLRVRRFVPPIGGMDLSPLVVLLGLWLLKAILFSLAV